MPQKQNDESWMSKVILLADSPQYSVLPNPKVGAMIVSKKGKILGQGFHRGPGLAHAEVEAINDAEKKGHRLFQSSTLYVNLEPCCHLKKRTPPCCPLLIEKKFKRVVIAMKDPNPAVSGKGIAQLKKAGIKVEAGCLQAEAEKLNEIFIINQTEQRSFLSLKLAQTFDGKLADDFGESKWISGEEARSFVHLLRNQADAIGIGSKTLLADDPHLNIRIPKQAESFPKVVIFSGRRLRPSKTAQLLKGRKKKDIIVIDAQNALLCLKQMYREFGICHLLVEGGAELASFFLKAKTVDRLHLFYGRGILGGQASFSLGRNWGLRRLKKTIEIKPLESRIFQESVYISAVLKG